MTEKQIENKVRDFFTKIHQPTFHGWGKDEIGKLSRMLYATCDKKSIDKDEVRKLLEKGADPNKETNWGITALQRAFANGGVEVARLLVQFGADVDIHSIQGKSCIHYAAEWGDLVMIKYLLTPKELGGADAKFKIHNGEKEKTPLHWASEKGHIDIVEFLAEKGYDLNEGDDEDWTPLHWAATYRREKVVDFLLHHSVNLESRTIGGETPLHWACFSGAYREAKKLIKSGADIEVKNKNRRTPLHWAALGSLNKEIAELLIQQGANVHAKDKDNQTPLDLAKKKNNNEVVELLEKLIC